MNITFKILLDKRRANNPYKYLLRLRIYQGEFHKEHTPAPPAFKIFNQPERALFPNYFNDRLTIKNLPGFESYILINLQGRMLAKESLQAEIILNTQTLVPDSYF